MRLEMVRNEVVDLREQLDRMFEVVDGKMPVRFAYSYSIANDILNFIYNLDINEVEEKFDIDIKKGFVNDLYFAVDDAIEIEDITPFYWEQYKRVLNWMDLNKYKGN